MSWMYKKCPKLKKKKNRKSTKDSEKLNSVISIAYRKKALGVLKSLKLYIFWDVRFWLWENLNFAVWTYSIISRCCYKCNKGNLSLIKAMLCRIRNYFLFIEHTSSCFDVLTFVCNWWWKLFTTSPKWTQTFHGCLSTSINRIWVFYDVLYALSPNKCL